MLKSDESSGKEPQTGYVEVPSQASPQSKERLLLDRNRLQQSPAGGSPSSALAVVTPKPTLHSIIQDYIALDQVICEAGGELDETVEAWLTAVSTSLAEKVDSYEAVMSRSKATAEVYKEKARQYHAVAKGFESLAERLKERVKATMEQYSITEISGNEVTFKLSHGTGERAFKIVIDEARLPKEYFKLVPEPDKDKIREDLAFGLLIEGVQTVPIRTLRATPRRK